MSLAMWLLLLVLVVLLVGAIPSEAEDITAIFRTPAFMLLLAALAGMLIWSCAKQRRSLRWFSFAACHLGIVAILVGGLLGNLWGVRRDLNVIVGQPPVRSLPSPCQFGKLVGFMEHINPLLEQSLGRGIDPVSFARRFSECKHTAAEQKPIDLGFSVAATEFNVEYYGQPAYDVIYWDGETQRLVETIHPELGKPLGLENIPGLGELKNVELLEAKGLQRDGLWVPMMQVGTSWILVEQGQRTPKHFQAQLSFNDQPSVPLSVNYPADFGSWRFYLMSNTQLHPELPEKDPNQQWQLSLLAKKDPGQRYAVIGFWMLIIGTAGLCLPPKRNRHRQMEEAV